MSALKKQCDKTIHAADPEESARTITFREGTEADQSPPFGFSEYRGKPRGPACSCWSCSNIMQPNTAVAAAEASRRNRSPPPHCHTPHDVAAAFKTSHLTPHVPSSFAATHHRPTHPSLPSILPVRELPHGHRSILQLPLATRSRCLRSI